MTDFTNGVLTITLNDGSTVKGMVTDATNVECVAPEDQNPEANDNDNDDATTSSTAVHTDGDPGSGDNGGSGGGDQSGGDNNMACSAADLTPGTVVQEAELSLTSSGDTWDKVDLVMPGTTGSDS